MYRIYDAEDMHEIKFTKGGIEGIEEVLTFESLDEFENFLDDMAEAWDCIDDTEEGTIYEVTTDGETMSYLIAIPA